MYLSGTLRAFRVFILSSFIFSTKFFCAYHVYLNFLFSISFTFLLCSFPSSLPTICFFNSFACFFSNSFLSFSNCSSMSFSYFCFLTAASNSAFSALACSSSLLSFSSCCSIRAYYSSLAFLALISASILSFSLAAL